MSLSPSNCLAAGCHVRTGHPADQARTAPRCHVVVYHEYESCGDCHEAHSGPVTVTDVFGNCESCHNVAYPSVPAPHRRERAARSTRARVRAATTRTCSTVHGVIPTGSSYRLPVRPVPRLHELAGESRRSLPATPTVTRATSTTTPASTRSTPHPPTPAPVRAVTRPSCSSTPTPRSWATATATRSTTTPARSATPTRTPTAYPRPRPPSARAATPTGSSRMATRPRSTRLRSAAVAVLVFDDHDSIGQAEVWADCGSCHSAELGPMHATCAPPAIRFRATASPAGTRTAPRGAVTRPITRGHPPRTRRLRATVTRCHYGGNRYYVYCDGCHPAPDGNDTTPPVTTSDAKASYNGSAKIVFSARVTVARSASSAPSSSSTAARQQRGDEVVVLTAGSHSVEFWSVDQNGNEEAHKSVSFTVAADTTAPVTTSDAKASYVGNATITLTPTDASSMGVRNTYYTINGGATQSGRTISIPAAG